MNVTLQIKKVWLDKILSGEKTVEYRDVTDYYIDRLCQKDEEGLPAPDPDDPDEILWKKIETITFICGYRKDAFRAVFKCEGIELQEYEDDEGNPTDTFCFALLIGERVS